MASEAQDVSELSSMLERLVVNRDFSLFLPFIFGFANNLQRREQEEEEEGRGGGNDDNNNRQNDDNSNNRVILINPFTQGMMVIDGVTSMDSLLQELGNKDGQPPASKESVKAMPSVEIGEEGEDCVICLEEFEKGALAQEMPCKHRFHGHCIEKWLGIHGTCPVCRHKMPVDEEGEEQKTRRRGGEREIWVSFSFNSRGRTGTVDDDANPNQTSSSSSSSTDSASVGDHQVQG